MKVEVLSRELIRPYTSTPWSLREYSLSLVDELSPAMYVPIILYFTHHPATSTSRCHHLKMSLSKVLTRFYPFAGRYMKDSFMVDCSDQGAEFLEAIVDVRLDQLLGQGKSLKTELLNQFIPSAIGASGEVTDPLLAVQVSSFACGGYAIGVMTSHKIADMSTACTFVNEWAIAATRLGDGFEGNELPIMHSPVWDSASLFPGKKVSGITFQMPREKQDINDHKIATKVFSFSNSAISKIREKVRVDSSSESLPTRVQSVFGTIGKSMIDINAGDAKEFLAVEPVNMRERTVPPISKNQCGNLYLLTTTLIMAGEAGVELHSIVDNLVQTVKRGVEKCKMVLSAEGPMISDGFHEVTSTLAKPNIGALSFSDWSKFPFYEADFGAGKPVWVSIVNLPGPNCVYLLGHKFGEGFEAWVNLHSDDMVKFEQDSSIMEYST